ncbi:peptidylprolyl isomerase [Psychroflexus sp. ALD_RP9]|uniref:peptidylprolyl isomerase n=1 Tax=Psychroflexus sp. ALD_RP9 TaxID=2777186 RepID=UPI001A8D62DF|nr:peptidylprolyl isomerase [Psychroflexus sp. ALD_RP9]QSS97581.1 peptidylprolyl isomerase [Psychroflexus sp. ALD_RP9]
MKFAIKIVVFLVVIQLSFAQNYSSDDVLFTIENKVFTAADFIENYKKNLDIVVDESQKDVDHYLDLYIDYQLKLRAAEDLGIDTSQSFLKEYKRYYKQLADNYIANGDVTEAMLKETFNRIKTEVRAKHILIKIEGNQPQDTLKAYNKALAIAEQVKKGANFSSLAKKHSADPSAKLNGGDMGWFNAFKMVYPFESAAYNLKLGEVSQPVKTRFGYHIIQKTGERESRGKIKVSHIMITPKPNDSTFSAEQRINEIYKLTKTEDFSDLAKQYSADQNTAKIGGELPYFAVGGLNDDNFEDTAFALAQVGDISKPVKTKFGWHIIKLLDVKPLEPYEAQKEDVRRQVKTSSRAKLINKKIAANLKQRYNPKFSRNHFMLISDEISGLIENNKFRVDSVSNIDLLKSVFLKIQDESYSYKDYFKYLELNQRTYKNQNSPIEVISASKEDYLYDKLIKFHRSNLVNINPEFAKSIKTFKEGILLFEVMEQQIWEPVTKDSITQKTFYESHKDEFFSKASIQAKLFSTTKKSVLKDVRKAYIKFKNQSKDSIFTPHQDNVIIETDKFTKESTKLPKVFFNRNGVTKIKKHNNTFLFIDILSKSPSRQLTFKEVRGKVISQLQKLKENKWLNELRNRYKISIKTNILNKIEETLEDK